MLSLTINIRFGHLVVMRVIYTTLARKSDVLSHVVSPTGEGGQIHVNLVPI